MSCQRTSLKVVYSRRHPPHVGEPPICREDARCESKRRSAAHRVAAAGRGARDAPGALATRNLASNGRGTRRFLMMTAGQCFSADKRKAVTRCRNR